MDSEDFFWCPMTDDVTLFEYHDYDAQGGNFSRWMRDIEDGNCKYLLHPAQDEACFRSPKDEPSRGSAAKNQTTGSPTLWAYGNFRASLKSLRLRIPYGLPATLSARFDQHFPSQ